MLGEILKAVENSPFSLWISESTWAFQAIETVHVFAIAMVFGTIAIVDLRLLGLASTNRRYGELAHELLPWTWVAWMVSATCGTLLFISRPIEYLQDADFRLKFLFMAMAGVNMLVFQLVTARDAATWDGATTPPAGKVAGGLSLVFWIGVIYFARKTGYTLVQGGV